MSIEKIVKRFREGGVTGVARGAVARLFPEGEYQEKLETSFEERWQMIRPFVESSGSLLDIGSNLGDFTARAASQGLFSVGLEREEDLIQRARRKHSTVQGCAFMRADLDLAMCGKLPNFDVILLLSVHHHWHRVWGPKVAADMLRAMVAKANHVLIFEGPSRTGRYERDLPEFEDNSEESITGYYHDYLEEVVGSIVSNITLIGKTACVGEREPYRWMYALER